MSSASHSGLRVALLFNMNNNFFAMARYLRDRGIDADLLMFEGEFDHFHPRCDAFDADYMGWVHQLEWGGPHSYLKTKPEKVRRDLQGYDVLIGCGLAPAYCLKGGRVLDVMVPYGYDVWEDTFYRRVGPRVLPTVWLSVAAQRKGMRSIRILHAAYTNALYEGRFARLAPGVERWTEGIPMVYAPGYERLSVPEMCNRTHWGHLFASIRKSVDFMMVSHGRHFWGEADNPNTKGNDKLLGGWAIFCARTPKVKKKLVLIEYGRDVDRSRAYVRELGIQESVAWLPKMYRKDLMPGLFMADMVAAEFEHSWMTSGVLYEALVASKPILAYREDKLYRDHYPDLYPIYNARSPEEIAHRLEECCGDAERGREIGRQGRRWYEVEVVQRTIDKYGGYIGTRAAELGKSIRA